jgi:hypothetical protein
VGKKVQELTADLGVVGIVEGKLGGGGSTKDRAGAARFRGRRGVLATGVQEGQGELVKELRRGRRRGGTSVRLETGRQRGVRSPARRSGLRTREEEE